MGCKGQPYRGWYSGVQGLSSTAAGIQGCHRHIREERCPLQWRAGPTCTQRGSKALGSVPLSAEGCQNEAEARVQSCDGDAPAPAWLYHQRAPAPGRPCPPEPSSPAGRATAHPAHPTSPGPSRWMLFPLCSPAVHLALLGCQSGCVVCKCPENTSEPQQAHHRAQGYLQSMFQMIWTPGLLHNPLSIPLSQ